MFIYYLLDFHEFHGAVESAWHRSPVFVGGLLIVDIHHVDFLHLAPLYALTVEFCDAIGWQIGNLDADDVLALVERILAVEDIWYCPGAAYIFIIDLDAGTFTYIPQVDSPLSLGIILRQLDGGFVNTCSHHHLRLVAESFPGLYSLEVEGFAHLWSLLGE